MSTSTAELNASTATPRRPTDLYRVLLLSPLSKSGDKLLVAAKRPPLTLPCVEIPKWERVAENMNAAVRKRYGMSAICLFTPDVSDNTTDIDCPLYQVMVAREDNCAPPEEMYWLPIGSFSDQSFADPQDFSAIKNALRQTSEPQNERAERPFAKLGWLEELLCWIQHQIDPHGLRLNGELRQLNASPTFALLRLETNGPALWFKAVGKPNLREFSISIVLAKLFPGFVPTIIATHPVWNGWLATESPGSTLEEVWDACVWERTAQTLAELQIASINKTHDLLDAGCKDLTISFLVSVVDPFFEVMPVLMERQQKASPQPLDREYLQTLAQQIKEVLSEWADLDIPDTLGHLDFNPGNIVCSADQCVFLDWAEAFVGPPFLTLEYSRVHLTKQDHGDLTLDSAVKFAYARKWASELAADVVEKAQVLAPILAVFAYAAAQEQWRDGAARFDPSSAAYLRALTRRMQKEMWRLPQKTQHPIAAHCSKSW